MAGIRPNPGTEGETSGDGAATPFGDGVGSTQAGGPSSGAHDFVRDPASHAPMTGGRDFNRESRAQRSGAAPDLNQDSVPQGGTLPFAGHDANAAACEDAGTIAGRARHMPFNLGGNPGHQSPAMPMVGEMPEEGGGEY